MDQVFLGVFETLIQAVRERYGLAAAWVAGVGGVALVLLAVALLLWWIVQ
ncbi:hypothetical protein HNP52_000673 [Sphingomonas kyeonggiensis]|uniref:Uncharacterized protein n=1 Tax=Sphingomonas kyeonggiensis TaxID=1268553 RepID=A0A7W7JYC8_9SPHN|nr:hypothetical protein [Sphingomonas kyeonggiensis]MBB4837622.1 hypothetical protein [Sphingomonas kyeonggiensis]